MLIIRRRSPSGLVRRIPLGGPNVYVVIVAAGEARSTLAARPGALAEFRSAISRQVPAAGEEQTRFTGQLLATAETLLRLSEILPAAGEFAHSAALLRAISAAGEFRSSPTAALSATAETRLAVSSVDFAQGEGGRTLIVEQFTALAEAQRSLATRENAAGEFSGLTPLVANVRAVAEALIHLTTTSRPQAEANTQIFDRIIGQAEFSSVAPVMSVATQIIGAVEVLARVPAVALAVGEIQHQTLATIPAQGEDLALAAIAVTRIAQGEARSAPLTRIPAQGEAGLTVQLSVPGSSEVLLSIRRFSAALGEVLGNQVLSISLPSTGEFRSSQAILIPAAGETRLTVTASAVALAELLHTVAPRIPATGELLASLLRRVVAQGEAQGQSVLTIDLSAAGEISGTPLAAPAVALGLGEFGPTIASIILALGEDIALFGTDPRSALRAAAEAGWLQLDKTHATISSGRVRLITVPYTAPQVQARPFDPLAALSLDTFGFDLTADAGGATIVLNEWSASFDPDSTQAFDDVPQGRIITTWSPTTIHMTNPLDNTQQAINGTFTLAMIGTCPASAVGGTYTIVAHIIMSDTREWFISSSFLCTETT